jgi:hypothetical protein
MSDDLRARMRAVFSNSGKSALQRYNTDFTKETSRYSKPSVTQDLSNQINAVTRARTFSANNKDSQRESTCTVCNAGGGLWQFGAVLIHQECARFMPKPEAAEPSLAYRGVSPVCAVTIVELPQAQRYRNAFGVLQLRSPALVPFERWRQCIEDGSKFLARWGEQAEALGWDSAHLFGLHTPPEQPPPSYSRLSRCDCTGLCWFLQGRPIVALTEATASIRNPSGSITVFRKNNRPAYGPLGDSLDDFK